MTSNVMALPALKGMARALRARLREDGVDVAYALALECVARQHGARDWNTVCAACAHASAAPCPWRIGQRVRGAYLGRAFRGRVHALSERPGRRFRRITLHFDVPVDVARFDSFSVLRQRVSGVIDADGVSPQRTSDGLPHLMLERCAAS